ncbi:hypothetical protein GZ78_16245 [Endozoicomonas numazuensis]|uniref:Uncharacterized protein n=1 Tax=Endozoicomonas numazuensis TaxID=1137799 RepID=A0A081NFY0_9GAMM|nr:hypothetical protein GZ78_16245 [Endozoicomonas numazuensis]
MGYQVVTEGTVKPEAPVRMGLKLLGFPVNEERRWLFHVIFYKKNQKRIKVTEKFDEIGF